MIESPAQRGSLAGGLPLGQVRGTGQASGPIGELEQVQLEVLAQFAPPVEDARPGLVVAIDAGGIIDRGHRGRGVDQKDDVAALQDVALEGEHRAEQQDQDEDQGHEAQGQQDTSLPGRKMRKAAEVQEKRENDRSAGGRQDYPDAVT